MKLNRTLVLMILMVTGEIVFLLPFVVARIFRPTFLKVFEINNLELGSAFSIYGIIAMISYVVGGPIADRFSPRKLMSFSLLLTAVGGVFMASIPNIFGLTMLYAFWGMSTILLYWSASIKAIRAYGGNHTQGIAFGLVDGGRGFIAAILASISVWVFSAFLPVEVEIATPLDMAKALSQIIYLFIGLIIGSAALIWLAFPKGEMQDVMLWYAMSSPFSSPTKTVQAPQSPSRQPIFVPFSCLWLRIKSSKVIPGFLAVLIRWSLSINSIIYELTFIFVP